MATPKKKHLIELMIEAGVKWPDGAEYAAQDKYDLNVNFYKNGKPDFQSGYLQWMTNDCTFMSDYGIELDSLCRNWHQTIVTREQYAEAMLMQTITGSDKQEQQTHSGEAGVMSTESIESLLAEIKAKREEHTTLVTKADTLALDIANVEQQVNAKLKKYGFAMSSITAASHQFDKPWKIGDKCIVDDNQCIQSLIGKECVIIAIDSKDESLPYRVEFANGYNYWVRNISRP